MNKKFKVSLGIFLTVMLVTLSSVKPKMSIATDNNTRTSQEINKNHILYLKSNQINLDEVGSKLSDSINIGDELNDKNYFSEKETSLYIIAFNGPVEEYMKDEVKNLGVELIEYIPDFAFISRINLDSFTEVLKLSYVTNVIPYTENLKVDPFFKDNSGNMKNDSGFIKVETFNETSSIDDVITKLGGKKLEEGDNEVVIELNYNKLEELASSDFVKYIEPFKEKVLFNDIARGYMDVENIWNLGYTGSDQIVGICDTGLDTGVNDSSMHLDFQGRINAIYPLGRDTADDTHGHGTHVAGSVLGNGAKSNGQIKGIAPEANLVFQSVLDSYGGLRGIPVDLNTLFEQAYKDGARIHSNSWGAPSDGEYDTMSKQVDEYVWNNNDMIILFAAGNEGLSYGGNIAYNTIGTPASAKNCITVGATKNYRPEKGDLGDNPNEVVGFSSRGNCRDGRFKPDIVAPGSWILSTKSSQAPVSNFWEGYNDYYAYMGGTSMATPLTAGAVTVAREYMQKKWNHTPSAALMKAAIINGGTNLGYGYPSKDQGWGRVSLKNSLSSKEYKYEDNNYKLTTGQSEKFTYSIESNKVPLKVSLVWTDYPGSSTTSKALVNDLDIKITSPSGAVYYGNDFSEPYNDSFDRLNNVENIFINNPEIGNYNVEIIGYNVPQGPQPFALFSSADFRESGNDPEIDNTPPSCRIVSPQDNQNVNGTITISADAEDDKGVKSVEFYIDDVNIGKVTEKPYEIQWDSKSVQNGNHTIKVKVTDTSNNEGMSSPIAINVDNESEVDTNEPSCRIASPQDNQNVSGTTTISADAEDDKGIKSVEFYIDDVNIGKVTEKPYEIQWDSKSVQNGNHTIKVKAIDTSNNEGTSLPITINVNNGEKTTETKMFRGFAGYDDNPEFHINVNTEGKIEINLRQSGFYIELYDPKGYFVAEGENYINYDATTLGEYTIVLYGNEYYYSEYTLKVTYPTIK